MDGGTPWWVDFGWTVGPRGLALGDRDVASLAEEHGTPLFLYAAPQLRREVDRLRTTLAATGLRSRIRYAMKANRFPDVLAVLRAEEDVGTDVCSPRELQRALACGFRPDEISATVSMPSTADLAAYAAADIHVNLDTRSAIRRYAAVAPRGASIGLRFDPAVRLGYGGDQRVSYAGTKFGLLEDDLRDAHAVAVEVGLRVDTVHMHLGWGVPREARGLYVESLARLTSLARDLGGITHVNIGGGLGARRRAGDAPLRPEDLVDPLREHVGALGATLVCEPGTLVVDSCGILVVRVSSVERKGDATWVGVDAGHNLFVYAAYYGLPVEVVHVARPGDAPGATYSVAGHINEAVDVFAREVALPEVREGDLLAIVPAGAYGSSMASDHCMRGEARELLVDPDHPERS